MQRFSRQFVLASVFMASSAAAQVPAAAPAPCATPAHRQFDFWVGEWEVSKPDGTPAGRSRIERILEACVISENWTGATGFAGRSFNLYNAASGRWEQFWVDQSGARLHLQGGLEGERMVLAGTREATDAQTGPAQRERISWTPNADGSVRQLWETSKDDGRTWTTSFDGLYRRAPAP
jgi:hypothetical protein